MTDDGLDGNGPMPDAPAFDLLDGVDVDEDGIDAPDGVELADDEIAGIRASQADPSTSPADADAN
jgi:hypothetical protein